MGLLESRSSTLPERHRSALAWFAENAGRTFPKRPIDVGLGVKLTSGYKGIWKPAATRYALSVVQTHKGVYPDMPPEYADDGTWTYYYHQEGSTREDLADPSLRFANVALLECKVDGIPVGVITPAPGGEYLVLGLAFVEELVSGYFVLSGPATLELGATSPVERISPSVSVSLIDFPPFDPDAKEDGRQRAVVEVVRRQGQLRFRRILLQAYEGRCAMSDYDAEPALEAAHIISYRGSQTNHPANGLLLRADLHDLFDLGLVAVETDGMRIGLAKDLAGTMYEPLAGRKLRIPVDRSLRPSPDALDRHRERSLVA